MREWVLGQCSQLNFSFLSSLNYLSIESIPSQQLSDNPSAIDQYLWVRSSIVLGRYDAAREKLEKLRQRNDLEVWFDRFLRWQLAVYQRPASNEAGELLR